MKAAIYTAFGPPEVLHIQEVAKPTPKQNELLVRVHASTVNYGEVIARNFSNVSPAEFNMPMILWLPSRLSFGLSKPRNPVLGSEFAGEVEAVGEDVTRFRPGDQVFGYRGARMGAYAEAICVAENSMVAHKPATMTYAEAAAVPYGAIMALSLLRKVDLKPGQKVLVNGASGGIGAAAVQLARWHFGAQVTGVCGTPRLAYVQALGAEQVIDYTQEDFTRRSETYDVIFDILGRSSFARCRHMLKPDGTYLLASFKMKSLFDMLWTSVQRRLPGGQHGPRVLCALSSEKVEDLVLLKELVEAGKFKTIIDRSFALEQAAAAHRYYESGHKQGAVVLTAV